MKHLASRAVLSAAFLLGSGMALAATDVGSEQLKQFQSAVTNPKMWFHKDGTSRLDLAILVPAQGGQPRKSLDGKAQVVVKNRVLKVRVGAFGTSTSLRAYDVTRAQIDAWYKRTNSKESYAGLMGKQAQRIADEAGLNCEWKRSPIDNLNNHCVYRTAELIEQFIALHVRPCAQQDDASCMEVEGKKWKVERPGADGRKKGSHARLETLLPMLLSEMLPSVLEVVDASGAVVKDYKTEVSYSDRAGSEDIVLGTIIKSSFPRDDFAVVDTITLETLMLGSVVLETRAHTRAQADRQQAQAAQKRQAETLKSLRAEADKFAALRLEGKSASRLCTTGTESKGRVVADPNRLGMLHAAPFRSWSDEQASRYNEVFGDLSSLYNALGSKKCNVVVESGANLAKLADALKRDKVDFTLMDESLDAAALREPYARSRGFDNVADMELADKFDVGPMRLKEYRAAGVRTEDDYASALSRMQQAGYRGTRVSLLDFLSDEKVSAVRGIPVAQYQSERLAKEQKEAQARKQARLNAKPYRVELSCGMGVQSFAVAVCLQSHGNSPTIHIRTGNDYQTYRYFDLHNLGKEGGGTFTFTVPPKTRVGVQNGSDMATLTAKVTDLRTNSVVHQASVGPYQPLVFDRP